MRRISLPPADPNSVRGEIERKAREQEEEQARKSKLKRRRDEAIGQVVTEFKRTCKRAADAGRSSAEQTSRARTAHLSPGAKPRESDVCAVEAGVMKGQRPHCLKLTASWTDPKRIVWADDADS